MIDFKTPENKKLYDKASEMNLVVYRSDTRNESFFLCSDMRIWLERHGIPLERMLSDGVPATELLEVSNFDVVAVKATLSAIDRRRRGVTDVIARRGGRK